MLYSGNVRLGKKGVYFTDKHGNKLPLSGAVVKIVNRMFNWWLDLKLFLVHAISLHLPIYFLRKLTFRLAGVKIGKGSTIHMGCKFFNPKGVKIGKDTIIGDSAFLDGRSNLTIGDHVDIASEVMVYNSEHDINDPDFKAIEEPVSIADYCFIGPRAIILPGVSLGKGVIVAAGAVVTKSVDNFQIVGGVPAKVLGVRKNNNPKYVLGRARLFQ